MNSRPELGILVLKTKLFLWSKFKLVLDDTTHANVVDGSITPTISYLMPDTLTVGTTSFDVSPVPTFAVVDDFTSPNDS